MGSRECFNMTACFDFFSNIEGVCAQMNYRYAPDELDEEDELEEFILKNLCVCSQNRLFVDVDRMHEFLREARISSRVHVRDLRIRLISWLDERDYLVSVNNE
jgi:hypothetical protein